MSVVARAGSSFKRAILKSPFIQKVKSDPHCDVRYFLPKLKNILQELDHDHNIVYYGKLLSAIREDYLEEDELMNVLTCVRECVYLLDKKHHLLIDILLSLQWIHRSEGFIRNYQEFLLDVLSTHNYYIENALNRLIPIFTSGEGGYKDGVPGEAEWQKFAFVHDILKILLELVPLSSNVLLDVITKHYPYVTQAAHQHECFVYNLLSIAEYEPRLQFDIMLVIMKRLISMDVAAPKMDVQDQEEENDNKYMIWGNFKMKHSIADSLDVSMIQIMMYIQSKSQDWDKLKLLYHDMVTAFDQVVIVTYATHYVQFFLFYLCSFKVVIARAFLRHLWQKVLSPNVASIIKQASVMYMGSLLARASYITSSMLKSAITQMVMWIHSYISSQDALECRKFQSEVHAVFNSVCQSLFYVIAFKQQQLVSNKKNLAFLQSLNLTKIVTCRLNPLRACQPTIVQKFASVTRAYQLAYCYTVIEHNARYTIPTSDPDKVCETKFSWLETFFPFDPLILPRTQKFIQSIYCPYQEFELELDAPLRGTEQEIENAEEEEEDDFLTEHVISDMFCEP